MTSSPTSTAQAADPPERDWITDFDHHDPAFAPDPHRVYDLLRTRCPVAHSDAWGGFYPLTRYADVDEVIKDDDRFRSGVRLPDGGFIGVTIPVTGQTRPVLPIEVDPPDAAKYRRLLNPFYTVQAVKRREPSIRELVTSLIDEFISAGETNLCRTLTDAVPGIVTMRELGLPVDRWREAVGWIETAIHSSGPDPQAAFLAGMSIYAAIGEAIADRRRNGPREDQISKLIGAEVGDRAITDEEIMDMGFLLLLGGLDTTATTAATAFHHLTQNPGHRERLIADRALIPKAVDEYLRYVSPVQGNARTVATHTRLGDVELKPGDRLFALWAAANHDPAVYDTPHDVVLDRSPNPHLAYGVGIHRCVGANLASTMLRVMFEEVLERLPDFRLDEAEPPLWFENASSVCGVRSLPVTFTPGPRR